VTIALARANGLVDVVVIAKTGLSFYRSISLRYVLLTQTGRGDLTLAVCCSRKQGVVI
jgi:hypothetical protein